ncbi:MAG: ROK family transcriptional regulator [Trueperaceae bacterium]
MPRGPRVNPSLIRQLNTARIFHAVRRRPGVSQRGLADATGLDKATVSTVVAALIEEGLLMRGAAVASGRRGRPERALQVDPDAGVLIGARLEPGSIRLLAATLAGGPLATLEAPGHLDPDRALDALIDGVAEVVRRSGRDPSRIRAIGVGVPALFDREGALRLAPNLRWHDVRVGSVLAERLDAPVYVDNDTKAAGLAELLFGPAPDVQDVLVIAGHSGIGGALYLGGRLYRGNDGFAGELGHMKVRRGGRRCGCGARGCLEAYLSEASLLRAAHDVGLPCDHLDALVAADVAGDRRARTVLQEAGEVLGDACADLVNLLNPERIVLGGTFAVAAARMLPQIEAALDRDALAPPRSRCEVRLSTFGADAVTMGGVALALEGFLSLPEWMLAREFGSA